MAQSRQTRVARRRDVCQTNLKEIFAQEKHTHKRINKNCSAQSCSFFAMIKISIRRGRWGFLCVFRRRKVEYGAGAWVCVPGCLVRLSSIRRKDLPYTSIPINFARQTLHLKECAMCNMCDTQSVSRALTQLCLCLGGIYQPRVDPVRLRPIPLAVCWRTFAYKAPRRKMHVRFYDAKNMQDELKFVQSLLSIHTHTQT